MFKNNELQTFLREKSKGLTEQWYSTLDKTGGGVYAETEPQAIDKLKQQNQDFHQLFCSAFGKEEAECIDIFREWVLSVANNEAHLATPFNSFIKMDESASLNTVAPPELM